MGIFMIIIHQFIFTLVAYFSLAHFGVIFKQTLTNTFISFILIAAILNLLQPRRWFGFICLEELQ